MKNTKIWIISLLAISSFLVIAYGKGNNNSGNTGGNTTPALRMVTVHCNLSTCGLKTPAVRLGNSGQCCPFTGNVNSSSNVLSLVQLARNTDGQCFYDRLAYPNSYNKKCWFGSINVSGLNYYKSYDASEVGKNPDLVILGNDYDFTIPIPATDAYNINISLTEPCLPFSCIVYTDIPRVYWSAFTNQIDDNQFYIDLELYESTRYTSGLCN